MRATAAVMARARAAARARAVATSGGVRLVVVVLVARSLAQPLLDENESCTGLGGWLGLLAQRGRLGRQCREQQRPCLRASAARPDASEERGFAVS